MNHKERWQAWRNISDRVISNPHYRYDDPRKESYLKLSRFAAEMMGHHNTLYWSKQNSGVTR